MRVAHIIKINNIAGAEHHLLALMAAQCERGMDVHLLMMVEPDHPMLDMEQQTLAIGAKITRFVIQHHLDLTMILRLANTLRQIQPDVVHTHLIHGDTFGIPAAKLARKPIISSRHDDSDFRRSGLSRWLNRILWRGIDRGIAISHALAQFSIEVEGAPRDQMRVVHYGIPHESIPAEQIKRARQALREELNLPPDTLLFGTVCRLIPLKRITDAIDAFAMIAPNAPQTHLVIVGDGPERSNLEQQASRHDLASRIHFVGWQTEAERFFSAFDVLLVPSTREGFGLVILEAMSKRVPVIATKISAIPEVVVDGETGFLIPPCDSTALAEAMQQLIQDPALCAQMGENGEKRLISHFSVGRMADETLAVYQEVMK